MLAVFVFSASLSLTARAEELIPMGQAVGIEAKTDGLLVTGLAEINTPEGKVSPAKDGGVREGDVIRSVAGREVRTAEDLAAALETVEQKTTIRVDRGGLEKKCIVTPYRDESGRLQLGLWLRDGVSGIGTVTYCDPATGDYGALGHGITDEEQGGLLPISGGAIVRAEISGARPGASGEPGELMGSFSETEAFGDVAENSVFGIFGTLTQTPALPAVSTAADSEVHTGAAVVRATVAGRDTADYAVTIDRVYREQGCTRYLLTVTDEALQNATGGIVQGMSGSPILQDGKLVGAVTHVLLSDSAKGYGVSIDTMLAAARAEQNRAA